MRILFLPKYTYAGASSRYRTYQFIPYFRDKNIVCDIEAFFNEKHIHAINQNKKRRITSYIIGIIKRIRILKKSKAYDLVFIEKELVPYFPGILEKRLHYQGTKYLLDYDDAIFHNYDSPKKHFIIRLLFCNKIPKIMKNAAVVITGSNYLAEYATQFAKKVILIPTVINLAKYQCLNEPRTDFIIGWIGSYSTSKYLMSIIDVLEVFARKYKSKIHLIGFNKSLLRNYRDLPIKIIPWSEESEVTEISKFSVGIAPLEDTPFARGKCAFKSIQYMACYKPVIASPVGSNKDIIIHEINGYLAYDKQAWFNYLELLYKNPDLCYKIGKVNRQKVAKEYSLESRLNQYIDLFTEVIEN